MGYTTHNSGLLLGLGVSAISDTGTAYVQNEKSLANYYRAIDAGRLAIAKMLLPATGRPRFPPPHPGYCM